MGEKAEPAAIEFTERGFAILRFADFNGVECTLQKSSIATEDCIWLGARDIGLKRFVPYSGGWKDVELESDPHGINHVANNPPMTERNGVVELLRWIETPPQPASPFAALMQFPVHQAGITNRVINAYNADNEAARHARRALSSHPKEADRG